jgi:hypothetical protein
MQYSFVFWGSSVAALKGVCGAEKNSALLRWQALLAGAGATLLLPSFI